jgi:hypothetical protein
MAMILIEADPGIDENTSRFSFPCARYERTKTAIAPGWAGAAE